MKGSSEVEALWEGQDAETRSLHDYLYNRAESALLEHGVLLNIPGDIESSALDEDGLRGVVPDTAFVLIRGRVSINDFSHLQELMDNYNHIGEFIARASVLDDEEVKGKKKAQKEKEMKDQLQLDKKFLAGMSQFLSLFYKNRIVVKSVPFPDRPDVRLVGNLHSDYLRDRIDSITYKYGTSPESPWMILGQMASIPPKDPLEPVPMFGGEGMEAAFQQMFDAIRNLELMAQTVTYPEAAITPIAVYRE